MAWVFQGNPEKFDIDDYITRYPELIYWRTPRHAREISVGDRAFIWRSGAEAGAVAVGVVVEAPTPGTNVKHPEALGIDLWRAGPPDPHEEKTGIHLQEIRLTGDEGFVSRQSARDDLILSKATIITMPNGTVFRLDDLQSSVLERLWGLTLASDYTTPDAATEGSRKLRSHFRRERSNALRKKKLAEMRRVEGQYICALCGIDEQSAYPVTLSDEIFEVHHLAPLSRAATPIRTTLDDLAVLCANCHRAVHATSEVESNYDLLAENFGRES